MSTDPAFLYESDFDPTKTRTRVIEHFDSDDKKRTTKAPFFEDTDSVEKLFYVFDAFIQGMGTAKAEPKDYQGHSAAALDTQATRNYEKLGK